MARTLACLLIGLLTAAAAAAAPKPHVITFGKTVTVKWLVGQDDNKALELKVRPLYVDARLREFTTGSPHDITDRLFVVQRAFRINDALPEDKAPQWRWQRGGWLLVDRNSGRISEIVLAEFHPYYSTASWYRDYVAYCGMDSADQLEAIVVQLGRRKPLVKKTLSRTPASDMPDAACPAPVWQRPGMVTFHSDQDLTFSVRRHAVGLPIDTGEED